MAKENENVKVTTKVSDVTTDNGVIRFRTDTTIDTEYVGEPESKYFSSKYYKFSNMSPEEIKKRFESSKGILQEMMEKQKLSKMMDADSEFGVYCDAIKQLHAKKNHDYGNAFGKIYKKYGIKYALAHMQEKLDRIESIVDGDKMVDEGIQDSLKDLASYALMTLKEFTDNKEV